MNFTTKCRIGTRVIVSPQDWLRPNEIGWVIDQKRDRKLKWLVQFEIGHRGGGGIDGDQLWLDQFDIYEVISEADTGDVIRMHSAAHALSPWEDPPESKAPANTFEREIYRYEKSFG